MLRPLTPVQNTTVTTNTTSSKWLIDSNFKCNTVEFNNLGSAAVFIRFGDSTVADAVANESGCYVVPPNCVKAVSKPQQYTHISVITASSGTLYVCCGEGL